MCLDILLEVFICYNTESYVLLIRYIVGGPYESELRGHEYYNQGIELFCALKTINSI